MRVRVRVTVRVRVSVRVRVRLTLTLTLTSLSVPFFYNPSLETVVEPLALPPSLAWERDAAYD